MTLEKLLIFGFAIAVATVLAKSGEKIADNRKPDYVTYDSKVSTLVDKTNNFTP